MGRDDGYYGYYPVYSRPICNGRLLNIRQIGFIDSQDSIRSIKTFGDLRQHMDYYIVANSFKSPKFRRAVNVHSLTNIVVDIDVHHARGGIKGCRDVIMQRLDALLYLIFVKKPIGLPCPNTVVHTGRGIQLWWTIKPLSAKKLKYIYKGIQEYRKRNQLCRSRIKRICIVRYLCIKKDVRAFSLAWNMEYKIENIWRFLDIA